MLMIALVPAVTLTVGAAVGEPTYTTDGWKGIFANGTPVTIKEDNDGVTKIYKDSDLDTPLFGGMDISDFVIYGGWYTDWNNGNPASFTGNTSITILSGTLNEAIFGGGCNAGINGNTNLILKGGTIGWIYGGGDWGNMTGNTNITIDDGSINLMYGGGFGDDTVTGNVSITVNGGTIDEIYGANDSSVTGDINITVNGGTINREIFAGGNTGTSSVANTNLTITDGTLKGYIYGGGYEGSVAGKATITITGGTLEKNIYGGSSRNIGTVGSVEIKVDGGIVEGNIYPNGGTQNKNVTGNATVAIDTNNATHNGSVFDENNHPYSLYTVSYNLNGGESNNIPPALQKSTGATIYIISLEPTREGYIFGGWNTLANGNGTDYGAGDSYSTDANLYLYAKWTEEVNAKTELAKLTSSLTAVITIALDDSGAETAAVTALTAAANAAIANGYTAVFTATSYNNGVLIGKFTVSETGVPANTAAHASDITFTVATSYTPPQNSPSIYTPPVAVASAVEDEAVMQVPAPAAEVDDTAVQAVERDGVLYVTLTAANIAALRNDRGVVTLDLRGYDNIRLTIDESSEFNLLVVITDFGTVRLPAAIFTRGNIVTLKRG